MTTAPLSAVPARSPQTKRDRFRVAVIIVNYNRVELTRRCLESLQAVKDQPLDIVVVDNGSTDGSREELPAAFPQAHHLLLDANHGFTGGNNAGIEWCLQQDRFDAILLLNNDAVVDPGFLDALVPHAAEGRIAAPQIRSIREPSRAAGLVGTWDWRRGIVLNTLGKRTVDPSTAEPVFVDFVPGCCLIIPSVVFRKVGVFDDRFFLYYEDTDLLVRAANAGVPVVYEPRALIFHDEGGSSGGEGLSPLRVYYNNRNRMYFMRKHARGVHFLQFLAYFLAGRMALVLLYAARGQWSLLRAMLLGIRDYVMRRMAGRSYGWS